MNNCKLLFNINNLLLLMPVLLLLCLFSFTINVSIAQAADANDQSGVRVKSLPSEQAVYTSILRKPQLVTNSKNDATGDNRISGGVKATIHEYPWMAYLELFEKATSIRYYVCGGTLINNQWVLTAAVCLDGIAQIYVYLGAHDIGASSEPYRVKYTTTDFIKHPGWRAEDTANNIGLIRLPRAISFTDQIKPIGLPLISEEDHVDDTVYLAGWGARYGNSSSLSSYLRKVNTTVMSNVECQSVYGTADVTDSDICSRGTNLVGICSGDNGGPMMFKKSDASYILLGVASFWYAPDDGCSSGYPSGFVRVSKYIDWIDSVSSATALIAQSLHSILLTSVIGAVVALRNSLF